mmetsp:Transcript_14867/g.31284  ORF Transcript_14867/g.31284 Transcript_14867/m.31284 type:complete len:145 (+) Transcript_14867:68-502(+)|eukprot:CAMPEP_0171402046 /NCGR_PEP_ID=MMETSP0880-20121228/8290_1 /TAXON_ID=67004 /ORGANISM="Thalassiosira weissflogii, Strain CCMP1336" /LENGTH=144 /DNA_ID=CAMNT_0011916639 /DNA_START=45 /DNA_END=479 /DNA_ORIENTATION=+
MESRQKNNSSGNLLTALFLATSMALCQQVSAFAPLSNKITLISSSKLLAGGWGNNQERPVLDEEFGGVNGAPIYDAYEIEDRGQFMKRVNDERKTLRRKKASDLLEVARIAGVELKKKERDPEKLDMFDPEDMSGPDEYLDVSI